MAKILITLTRSAMILAGIGLVGEVFRWKRILTFLTPAQDNFYSVFPHGHQWAAFALFWMVVSFGVLFYLHHRQSWKSLFSHNSMWLVLGWVVLAWSVYWTGAPVHHFLLGLGIGLLTLSTGLMIAANRKGHIGSMLGGGLLALIGCALSGGSIYYFASEFTLAQNDVTRAPFGIPWEVQTALWRDAWALFEQRPYFGWGIDAFADVLPFHQQIDLGQEYYGSPHSDLLQGLVEYGLVGMALWLIYPLSLMFAFARMKTHRRLSHYLWGGATLLALLSLVSQPLSSPANFVCLWIGLAMAFKWSQAAEQGQRSTPVARNSPLPVIKANPERENEVDRSSKTRHKNRRRRSN
nr:O-antigen ligase family protein [Cerasicoccus arenae]